MLLARSPHFLGGSAAARALKQSLRVAPFAQLSTRLRRYHDESRQHVLTMLYDQVPNCLATPLTKPNPEFGDIHLKRKMVPVDANPAGNVHGGTILELAEQAGYVAATRHMFQYNKGSLQGGTPALIRMGHFDFLSPAFIGDLMFVQAKVVFASRRTMQVLLHVWSETPGGEIRLTDRAYAWYVAVRNDMRELSLVPPAAPATDVEHELCEYGKLSYQKLKARSKRSPFLEDVPIRLEKYALRKVLKLQEIERGDGGGAATTYVPDTATAHLSPSETAVSLKSLILPSDCHHGQIAGSGVVMKMIDNAAGIVAFRHCKTNIVTAALDSLDFDSPIRNGNLVHVDAQAVFASQKSLEVMVKVTVEDMIRNITFQSNQALLTFVSLDENKKTRQIPGLRLTSSRERQLYDEGSQRYHQRKTNNKRHKVGL